MLTGYLAWIVTGIFLCGGGALLKRGLWPRRQGTMPHCRRCDYDLTDLTSEQCPECGQALSGHNVVVGRRPRRPRLTGLGALCIALPLAWWISPLRHVDWSPHHKPTAWLIADLRSTDALLSDRARQELDSRIHQNRLSLTQHRLLADVALDVQRQSVSLPAQTREWLLETLVLHFHEDMLSEAQLRRFCETLLSVELQVRPRVAVGQPVPWRVPCMTAWVPPRCTVAVKVHHPGFLLNGQPHPGPRMPTAAFVMTGGSCLLGGGTNLTGSLVGQQAGMHELTTQIEVHIYSMPLTPEDSVHGLDPNEHETWGEPVFETVIPLKAEFEVVEDPSLIEIIKVHDPAVGRMLVENLVLQNAIVSQGLQGWQVSAGRITQGGSPLLALNIACDVYGRWDGREFLIGKAFAHKGEVAPSIQWQFFDYDGPPVGSIDLIYRSNEQLAHETVDMFEIWEGEAVLENVVVTFK